MGQKSAIKKASNKCSQKISATIIQSVRVENSKRGLFDPNKCQL